MEVLNMMMNKGHYMGPVGDFIILYQQEDEEVIGFHMVRFNIETMGICARKRAGVFINFLMTSPALPRPRIFIDDQVLGGGYDA